jgi:microcystin degradation protein MlrC
MKRVLTASFHHESNTFNPIVTGREDFSIKYGNEIFNSLSDNDSISGIIKTLQIEKYEVIPTVFARAVPNGVISKPLYKELKEELLKRSGVALSEGPIDALVLALHGSMRIEEIGEAEGDLLEALRGIFPHQPIYVALDMHTSFSERMYQHGHFVGYKCAPHTDCFETGVHAARMAINYLSYPSESASEKNPVAKQPVSSWVSLPFLVAGEKSETTTEPMKTLIQALRECEKQPGILAASYLMGFPWADNSENTVSVLVEAEDKPLADKEAYRLARLFWSHRENFTFHTETYSPRKALQTALDGVSQGPTPIYISDSGDNPTAGSSGDVTEFLQLLLESEGVKSLPHPVLYGGIYDPAAVEKGRDHVGEEITLTVGAAFDKKSSQPLTITGIIKSYLPRWGTYASDMILFSAGNVDLVITAKHIGFIDPAMFRDLGALPEESEIVVCKLGYLTAPHRELAKRSIMALTKGSSNEDLESIPYKNIKRPVYPLDRDRIELIFPLQQDISDVF